MFAGTWDNLAFVTENLQQKIAFIPDVMLKFWLYAQYRALIMPNQTLQKPKDKLLTDNFLINTSADV